MGLKASDFDWKDLKDKEIVQLRINRGHESTVTVRGKDGTTERHRLPAVVIDLMETYATEVAA